ncbi:DNA recombination protein RmuC [Microlunatus soli]|uniref:DNA recombination protein RmuC n=1 Tax=Microlunatus soli TaxID=630515 RepID=A0A1H1QF49_9ACTN|nr:DNA recombination protein RmuC [Microlunatus soli]SDS22046.1 DNA recombination protein RmuC [Microlunatus soli]
MATSIVLALLGGLLLGALVAGVAGWLISRARSETRGARDQAELAQINSDQARTRSELAHAQAQAAEARSEAAQARTELARNQRLVAEARAEASAAQAEAAEVQAGLAKATAERTAAIQRAQEIAADREAMLNQFKVLSAETIDRQTKQADATAANRLKATEQLMAPVRESLDRFNARLTDVEKERAAMSADLRAQVQTVRQTGETLRQETSALVTALRKPQVRGAWGEVQLKRVAELSGMLEHCDFDLQTTTRTSDGTVRPDMRVDLSEGKHIFIDSKAPLSAFLDAAEADDPDVREQHLRRYAKHVRTHVDQLSSKQYWKAAETPEFVVLFLPSEAFFSTALEQTPDLTEYAARKDVVIATPTTLIGMLRSVAYGWRQAALAESAAEVFKLGRELHEKLGLMGNRFDKLGRALRTSVNAYNETVATVEGTVLVRARKFTDLKVSEADLKAPEAVDAPIRQIQAQELVDDAVSVEPMVGRESRRRSKRKSSAPEADELVRGEPDLFELTAGEAEPPSDADTGS